MKFMQRIMQQEDEQEDEEYWKKKPRRLRGAVERESANYLQMKFPDSWE